MPQPGIKPVRSPCSIHWATPARAIYGFLTEPWKDGRNNHNTITILKNGHILRTIPLHCHKDSIWALTCIWLQQCRLLKLSCLLVNSIWNMPKITINRNIIVSCLVHLCTDLFLQFKRNFMLFLMKKPPNTNSSQTGSQECPRSSAMIAVTWEHDYLWWWWPKKRTSTWLSSFCMTLAGQNPKPFILAQTSSWLGIWNKMCYPVILLWKYQIQVYR